MKPRVLVTRHVYPAAIAILQEDCTVDYRDTYDVADAQALVKRLQHADGVVCQLTDPLSAEVLAQCPKLKVIAQVAVGHDNIDVAAATARGIVVTNTPGVLTEATADLTFALLLAAARRLPTAERYLRDGQWRRWDVDLLCGHDVHGRTLGIVGMGRIGRAIARRAAGFSMRVVYHNRSPLPPAEEGGASWLPKDELLRQADHVVLMVPYAPATHHLIGAAELALMKPTAVLVNLARGGVVDDAALIRALRDGRLAAAGLDVFEGEPALNPGFLELENVVLTPHIASSTRQTREAMARLAMRNLADVLAGRRPPSLLNPEVWDNRRR
jgi:lactate dehydrogenase-like 2-hydroxyacid dehydrogenase